MQLWKCHLLRGDDYSAFGFTHFYGHLTDNFCKSDVSDLFMEKSRELVQTQESQLSELLKIHLAWHFSFCTKALHKPSYIREKHTAMKSELFLCVTVGPKMRSIPQRNKMMRSSTGKSLAVKSIFYPMASSSGRNTSFRSFTQRSQKNSIFTLREGHEPVLSPLILVILQLQLPSDILPGL